MSRKPAVLVIALLIAAIAAAFLLQGAKRGDAPSPPDAGEARPAGLPRLVDLGSDQCIPCKMMAPILEELQTEYGTSFAVEVIDVREDRSAAAEYGIRVIPTQIFYDANGEELFRHEGFFSKEEILAKWDELGVAIGAEDMAPADSRS